MNVLVYNGRGVSKTSLTHTLSTLRALLLPNYVVQTIGPQSVANDPWAANCALFVLPGGRDLPYAKSFERSSSKIADFVRNGGAFLGLCAGAYYACRRVEWEVGTDQEVSGDRPLRFFNGIGRGCTYPGFHYATEAGARAITLDVMSPLMHVGRLEGLYYNGGGAFMDAEHIPGCQVLARYTEGDGEGSCAGVFCDVDKGKAVLWAIHPEYPLTLEPALSAIANTRPDLRPDLDELEAQRWKLMRTTLECLGLSPPMRTADNLLPTAQFLFSTTTMVPNIAKLEAELSRTSGASQPFIVEDSADVFHIYSNDLPNVQTEIKDSEKPIRTIVLWKDKYTFSSGEPVSFNVAKYFSSLQKYRIEKDLNAHRSIGEYLLYGEVVTSTQTLLDKWVNLAL